MQFDELKTRAERTPYHEALGVRAESIAADRVRLRIPFKDENSNPGRALHGGVSASAINIGGALAAWTAVEERPGLEAATLDLTVNYLAAAIGEDIIATAEVLRRGKEIVYSEVDVRTRLLIESGGATKAQTVGLRIPRLTPAPLISYSEHR